MNFEATYAVHAYEFHYFLLHNSKQQMCITMQRLGITVN